MPPKDTRQRWEKERGWQQSDLLPASKMPSRSGYQNKNIVSPKTDGFKVGFYEGKGVVLSTPKIGNPSGKNGGMTQRGDVGGFSKKARAAMRKKLMTTRPADDRFLAALTLTVPGPPLTRSEKDQLWKVWSNRVVRMNVGMIWRLETQRRGAVHWHAVAAIPESMRRGLSDVNIQEDGVDGMMDLMQPRTKWVDGELLMEKDYERRKHVWMNEKVCHAFGLIQEAWLASLSTLGPVDRVEREETRQVLRSEWRGADVAACIPDLCDDQEAGWMRYMQDHCTKRKREQEASGMGRHWGVTHRDAFQRVLPDDIADLTPAEYVRLLRPFQRLTTPSRACERAPFGRKLGYTNKRGRIGTSYWFSRPDTVKRLVDWARS